MIKIDAISVSLGGAQILRDISLEVATGETVAIVGESGVGKTTLLHAAAGLQDPTGGDVRIDGVGAKEYLLTGSIAYLFQRTVLSDWLTTRDNVRLPLRVGPAGKRTPSGEDELVNRALELAQIGHATNKYPRQLSGGMRARVALAAALVRRPSVMLLDEPFSQLDPITRERVIVEVAPLLAGITCLLVTHDLNEALLLANRIVLLAATSSGACIVAEHLLTTARPRAIEYLDSPEATEGAQRIRALLRQHAAVWQDHPQEATR